jgi:hypothetical protein
MSLLAKPMKVRFTTRAMMTFALVITCVTVSAQSSQKKSQNHPPIVTLTPTPTKLCYGGTVTLFADAKDFDGDKLTYKYTTDSGQITGKGHKVQWKLSGMGMYEVRVEVSDGRGGLATASTQIIVFELCGCPAITINGLADVAGKRPLITFSLTMSGGQAYRKPSYSWTINAGKIVRGQGTPTVNVDIARVEADEITALVKINGFNPSCQDMASFTLINPLHKTSRN